METNPCNSILGFCTNLKAQIFILLSRVFTTEKVRYQPMEGTSHGPFSLPEPYCLTVFRIQSDRILFRLGDFWTYYYQLSSSLTLFDESFMNPFFFFLCETASSFS
jgi:hypothetical protein